MRVLVTGGAGFIGSHLIDALRAANAEVVVLDNGAAGRADLAERLRRSDIPVHAVDVTDTEPVRRLVHEIRPDVIAHLAGHINPRVSVLEPALDARTNVVGTVNVLDAADAVGVRVVFVSTGGAVYGEHALDLITEDTPARPESPYGTSKYCAEQYVALSRRRTGAGHVVLRLSNVYGPRQDPDSSNGVIAVSCGHVVRGRAPLVYGDGKQTRDFIHIADVTSALMAALSYPDGGIFNVGTGVPTSILDVVGVIGAAVGRPITPKFVPNGAGDLRHSCLDSSRIADALGWRATVGLLDGVRSTYEWFAAELASSVS
ncbi:UDP-glucose 4-epimerase [Kutzneria viridogrisea]|uniref:UDP-glucose 4-epimerase n=1 Tax=Kutzneria viridogrisea TaxID=47990 RepID=A0ABR6BAE7_9PSEU|nr:UDP-glucose 4-epimerase [Kutzneria viridogrisea]